jgi:DNA recombination protein RmuC
MDVFWTSFFLFVSGFLLGSLVTFVILTLINKKTLRLLQDSLKNNETLHRSLLEGFSNQLTAKLHETSADILSKSTDSMLKLASHQLNTDREIISHNLKHNKDDLQRQFELVNTQLLKVADMLNSSEKEKGIQMNKISSLISTANVQTADLIETTSSLKAILANSQARGQLGERIADDILRLAGFIENINYIKQKALSNGSRPDFTFLLPKGLILNMDVKFPIQNYTRYIQATDKAEKDKFCKQFLIDVKACYKELADRAYYDLPESVDCVILLIPHEQVFSFIIQEEPGMLDIALKNRVITCSPMTLFAVLAVVRKAIDHFTVEKTSQDILEQIASFRKQWELYCQKFQTLGKKISDLQNEYENLTNTRTRLLDKQLDKLERIQQDAEAHEGAVQ